MADLNDRLNALYARTAGRRDFFVGALALMALLVWATR